MPQGLWIDDDAAALSWWQLLFAKHGLDVELASDPDKALAGMELQKNVYQFVLLDLDIPGFDGVEILHRIRDVAPGIPIALISGHLGEPMWERRVSRIENLLKFPKPLPIAQSSEFHEITDAIRKVATHYMQNVQAHMKPGRSPTE